MPCRRSKTIWTGVTIASTSTTCCIRRLKPWMRHLDEDLTSVRPSWSPRDDGVTNGQRTSDDRQLKAALCQWRAAFSVTAWAPAGGGLTLCAPRGQKHV